MQTCPFLRRHKLANVEAFFVTDELRDNTSVHLVSVHKRLMPETEAYVAGMIEHMGAAYALLRRIAKENSDSDLNGMQIEAADLISKVDR